MSDNSQGTSGIEEAIELAQLQVAIRKYRLGEEFDREYNPLKNELSDTTGFKTTLEEAVRRAPTGKVECTRDVTFSVGAADYIMDVDPRETFIKYVEGGRDKKTAGILATKDLIWMLNFYRLRKTTIADGIIEGKVQAYKAHMEYVQQNLPDISEAA